jgi:hypothetical protein
MVLSKDDCDSFGGIFQGGYTNCEPNPCPGPTPTQDESWGRIKARFGDPVR